MTKPILTLLLLSTAAFAQTDAGSIRVLGTDASGGSVPNTAVKVTDAATIFGGRTVVRGAKSRLKAAAGKIARPTN